MTPLAQKLRDACNGHPTAQIPWPHRLLHEAADALDAVHSALKEISNIDMGETEDDFGAATEMQRIANEALALTGGER